jgi:glutathione peroxidase
MPRTSERVPAAFYDIEVASLDGGNLRMDRFRGQVLLIVNVASQCGFTPQYAGLEALYRKHSSRGFAVLGFPCNQFGRQEPGNEAEIRDFCASAYGITFPLFAKIDVNGARAHPLFAFLKSRQRGLLGASAIKWNFTKFLVDRAGRVTARFAPSTAPDAIERHVVALLG